jgi:transcriptional regulator with XRE-family HTH domain
MGYSAEQIAEFLNVSPTTVYRYENGDISKLPAKFIGPLAHYLNVSPSYLMGWTDEPSTRRAIPIVVPDSERFVKLVHYMSTADYVLVMQAFERAEKKLKEAEGDQIHT